MNTDALSSDQPVTANRDGLSSPGRRRFIGQVGALTLVIGLGGEISRAEEMPANGNAAFSPNAFIRIDQQGTLTVVSSFLEMGQGTFTGLATLAAEELDADWRNVRVIAAPADVENYANLNFARRGLRIQGTGGSTSMNAAWLQMRQAAATARAMLLGATAKRWKVSSDSLEIENGVVMHRASGRRARFGELAAAAAREPVPPQVTLKSPANFRLIGRQTAQLPRVDIPPKTNGTAIYTQDIKLPGMLVAVVAYPPRL
ncbi:molybdopterin cofactor-binding domain-containing protein [Paraburkholderia sp. 22B1P]|uniref:molybdopterin cofactor-binding domain-containing protein n=1 Tax=Paraburkholderia sp. 22B1P TaxID=3080498 RepID=UPI0030856B78|nr:hypothetical protein PBP221_86230 [Paraburkholderia sp. 22B1P]